MKLIVVPEDAKDEVIAKHMQNMINWHIVQSKSDKHLECGYPMGQVLCRSKEEAEELCKESEFKDCYFREYDA